MKLWHDEWCDTWRISTDEYPNGRAVLHDNFVVKVDGERIDKKWLISADEEEHTVTLGNGWHLDESMREGYEVYRDQKVRIDWMMWDD